MKVLELEANGSIKLLVSPAVHWDTHLQAETTTRLGGSLEKLPLSLQQRSWLGCYWGWRSRKLMLRWRKCSGDEGGEKEKKVVYQISYTKWNVWCSERMRQWFFRKGRKCKKKEKRKKVEQVDSRKSFEMSLGFLLILALCQTFRFNLCILKKLLDATRQTCVTLRSDSVNLWHHFSHRSKFLLKNKKNQIIRIYIVTNYNQSHYEK